MTTRAPLPRQVENDRLTNPAVTAGYDGGIRPPNILRERFAPLHE
jgi:hypothetical protein